MQRHDVDLTSLGFGLLFTVAGLLLMSGNPAGETIWLGWAGPAVAVAAGGLVIFAVRPRRPKSASTEVDEPSTDEAGSESGMTAPSE